jgi:hypothetical protein
LQKQIGTYNKTKGVFNEYQRMKKLPLTKWEKLRNVRHPADVYYDANYGDIALCKAAKKYFDEHDSAKNGKLPSINQLRKQWAELEKQKRALYPQYKEANKKFKDLCTAKSNASRMLGVDKNRAASRGHGMEI